jgi:hypothetical protein
MFRLSTRTVRILLAIAFVSVAGSLAYGKARRAYLESAVCETIEYGGDVYEVRRLLDAGADVNTRQWDRQTILMEAIGYQRLEVVKLLLVRGAAVNVRDKYGGTPLIDAASCGSAEIVKVLLAHGADIRAKDRDNRTALGWAKEHQKTEKRDDPKGELHRDYRGTIKLLEHAGGEPAARISLGAQISLEVLRLEADIEKADFVGLEHGGGVHDPSDKVLESLNSGKRKFKKASEISKVKPSDRFVLVAVGEVKWSKTGAAEVTCYYRSSGGRYSGHHYRATQTNGEWRPELGIIGCGYWREFVLFQPDTAQKQVIHRDNRTHSSFRYRGPCPAISRDTSLTSLPLVCRSPLYPALPQASTRRGRRRAGLWRSGHLPNSCGPWRVSDLTLSRRGFQG